MPKTTYDPELRRSEHGARLYETWKRMRMSPYDPVFHEYDAFYHWAIKSGYVLGAHLKRHDINLPYSPENCFWKMPEHSEEMTVEWALAWCERWDKTVSKLRRQLGLPPLKGGKS